MSTAKTRKRQSDEIIIPEKLYFRIGEVAELCDLPAYVLRFWETEFSQLKPTKGSTGQRMYRRRDVEHVIRIKQLLYSEGYTIAGAREQLKQEARGGKSQSALPFAASRPHNDWKRVKQGLQEVLSILSPKKAAKGSRA